MDAEFVYDGLGRCVKRILDTVETIFVYDGWKPIAEWYEKVPEYFQAWNVYGPGPDEILLRQGGKYGYLRFHLDRHGNVAFLVNNDGDVLEKYTYDVFGRPTVTSWTGSYPQRSWSHYGHCFLFQGREYIRELGIYDYRNRFYHPALGRFLQIDPIGFEAGDMNLFRYCGDNPVNFSDPTGLWVETAWDIFNVGLGAASLSSNIREGNWGSAALDGVGLVIDGAATAIPIIPAGVSSGIKAYRGTQLARNLANAGRPVTKGIEDAHHVVAAGAKAAELARVKLARFKIDIHSDANGAAILRDPHRKMHTEKYYQMVNERAQNWTTREAAEKGLREIADELEKLTKDLAERARNLVGQSE